MVKSMVWVVQDYILDVKELARIYPLLLRVGKSDTKLFSTIVHEFPAI